ncbi:MAG: phosphoribosylaminoimidazolesuccinocarboxamide synthase [Candidatus Omnitrophota bacterium]|nr:MAG: phosphoribosylaminoimidazolesuccinocarboxamide synthase [Candidatus Omnitrophota bacterium]
MSVLLTTNFKDLKLFKRGKVRDVYEIEDKLLIISTDRISAFDVVLPCGIPHKGKVLTALSCFWFNFVRDIIPHHLVAADVEAYPASLKKYRSDLEFRSMLVTKTQALPVECVVRGYLSGSGWKEYQKTESVCGIGLPAGLSESAKLAQPIFTPSTKEEAGHDVNVDFAYVEATLGNERAAKIRETSLAIYKKAHDYALSKGIIIADTKFEFGIYNNELMLIDEVLTPDSSRFWPRETYEEGKPQPSFDKQFVRDYLESLHWDKRPPAPQLPDAVIAGTTAKYLEAHTRLTGREFITI